MQNSIEVSIITPTYNSQDFIASTIESVQSQTLKNWELIITDDCSTDNTVELIRKYSIHDQRIRVEQLKKNMGADYARNNSIKLAKGRFIAFIDADDLWLPHKLKSQIQFMRENRVDLSYSSYYQIDESGKRNGKIIKAKNSLDYHDLLKNNYIGCLTAIYDTQRIGKVYMPNIRKRQDWALWLKISKLTDKLQGVEEPLAEYRVRNESISSRKINLLKYNWKIYRDVERFPRFKSLALLTRFLFYFLIKKIN